MTFFKFAFASCASCRRPSRWVLCERCELHARFRGCFWCGGSKPKKTDKKCYRCQSQGSFLDDIHLLYRGASPIGNLLKEIKQKARPELYRLFPYSDICFDHRIDAIVPIPSDPQSFNKRLFEPAYEIARQLKKKRLCKTPLLDLLERRPFLKSQKSLDRDLRFEIFPQLLCRKRKDLKEFKNILLVDDFMTSGASVGAAAQFLKNDASRLEFFGLARF